jgi:PHD/YefM family antitoxin component YafN of YafNO toxin-antitoxin module
MSWKAHVPSWISVNILIYKLIYLTISVILSSEGVDIMNSVISAITNTVPISLFNRGLAGKIFEEVKKCGAKVVMKNNTAECVLLSPDEYVRLMDEVNDARLLTIAAERMAHYDPTAVISADEMNSRLGITEEDLEGYEEVELE